MPSKLYGAYKSAGAAAGKYKSSLYDITNVGYEMQHEERMGELESKRREETIGLISEGLTLASNVYEGVKSKKEMSTIAGKMGAVEQKQSEMDWFFGAEKKYKIGEDEYTASTLKKSYEVGQADKLADTLKIPEVKSNIDEHKNIQRSEKPKTLADQAGMSDKSTATGGYTGSLEQNITLKQSMGEEFKQKPGESVPDWKKRRKQAWGSMGNTQEDDDYVSPLYNITGSNTLGSNLLGE